MVLDHYFTVNLLILISNCIVIIIHEVINAVINAYAIKNDKRKKESQ